MAVYINHKGRQTGPFDDGVVIERLRSGQLSPQDPAIRTGDDQWQTLGSLFPGLAISSNISTPEGLSLAEPQYRNTVLPKIFFAVCLLVEIVVFLGLAYYFYSVIDPSMKLADLLDRTLIGILLIMLSGNLVGGFVTLLAFVMAFKRKIIRSNALRIGIRIVSVLILLFGLGNFGFWGYQLYATNHAYHLAIANRSEPVSSHGLYDMMFAYGIGLIFVPIAVGLVLFGLSGILMAKRPRD